MKKFLTLLIVAMCCTFAYAQDLAFQIRNGKTLEDGAVVTVEGYLDETGMFELYAGIFLQNLKNDLTDVVVSMKALKGNSQICGLTNCRQLAEGETEERSGTLAPGELVDLGIGVDIMMDIMMDPSALFTRTVEVSAWTKANPDRKISAIVTFTNDPAVLGVEKVASDARIYAKDNVFYYNFANAGERELQLFDVSGQPCKSVRLASEQGSFSVEGMNKGLYLYRVTETGQRVNSGKVLVK